MSGTKKVWMVAREDGGGPSDGGPRRQHASYTDARAEAERLCRKENRAFIIFEAVSVCKPAEQPIRWETIDGVEQK